MNQKSLWILLLSGSKQNGMGWPKSTISGPLQQTVVKQTSVIATPYVLMMCKMFVFYASCGEVGGVDSMQSRKIHFFFATTCSHGSEVSQFYLLVWKSRCCMRETHGTIKLLPEASAASRQHQGDSAVWHGDTGNLPQYRFAGTRKKIKEALGFQNSPVVNLKL